MIDLKKTREPIAGYTVTERIGVGGYGEVWSARAPGGLPKAIKFVYGYFDDERAARELKALNRIKEVRHPFLLSLERIEVVDGQLLVVSELADMSLKDRYEQVKNSGFIPRAELLGYMRDAADALDYLSEKYSLQHLDIKPENLLLVGERIKVADFGLVKELHDHTASLMGGMTPVYAPPEVFDGRPSSHSDQYSLAIVFQEMLTGTLPFPGRTPAQLASQHLHARPRLTSLSAEDQPVIARALSKNPADRFTNCRAMVDALLHPDQPRRAAGVRTESVTQVLTKPTGDTAPAGARAKSDSDWQPGCGKKAARPVVEAQTQVLSAAKPAARPLTNDTISPAPRQTVQPIENWPPLAIDEAGTGLRPTLFVALGGAGGRVLRQLRRRLRDRLGPLDKVPTFQMLLFDTDSRAAYQATQGDADTALADSEAIALPLRNAHDYAVDSRNILQWLSRRWLYNIPRSLHTEGRRPLGRLSLVDHAKTVFEQLHQALQTITNAESIAAAMAAGVTFRSPAPRVVLVASICGGTGSGMVLDVACMIRKTLAELGLPDDGLCGMLLHSTDRNPTASDLATANAYACLGELEHFGRQGFYPGDPACGLPATEWIEGVLPQGYLVHLGDRLNEEEFDQATDQIANYLYLDSATPASNVLEQCRASAAEAENRASATLGTFGLLSIGSAQGPLATRCTELLGREVVDCWRGAKPPREESTTDVLQAVDVETRVARHAEELQLGVAPLCAHVAELLQKQVGGDAPALLARLREQAEKHEPGSDVRALMKAIQGLFGMADPGDLGAKSAPPPPSLDRDLKKLIAARGTAIRDFVLALVDSPGDRVGGAARARQWVADHLHSQADECQEQAKEKQQHFKVLEQGVLEIQMQKPARGKLFGGRQASKPSGELDAILTQMIQLCVDEAALHAAHDTLKSISAHVSATGDQIKDMQRDLGSLTAQFAAPSPWPADDEDAAPPASVAEKATALVCQALRSHLPELIRGLDLQFQTQFLAPNGGLRNVCQRADLHGTLAASLRAAARGIVLRTMAETSIAAAVLDAESSAAYRTAQLQACLDDALPKLSECGGGRRLLAIVPAGPTAGAATGTAARDTLLTDALSALDPPATTLRDTDAEIVFCFEVQNLSISAAAAQLVLNREDLIPAAARLHTRTDIAWQEMASEGQVAEPVGASS